MGNLVIRFNRGIEREAGQLAAGEPNAAFHHCRIVPEESGFGGGLDANGEAIFVAEDHEQLFFRPRVAVEMVRHPNHGENRD